MAMRVLIADRNARLLESISRTCGREFGIQTAATREGCEALLAQGEFDLALISEKLADGPGLQLLGQIARDSPDTLRVFIARRARLELLRGKLGPFGLFRTLGYPIDPQELLSVLTLARAGLEIGGRLKDAGAPTNVPPNDAAPTKPAPMSPAPMEAASTKPASTKPASKRPASTKPASMTSASTKPTRTTPAPAAMRATVEHISLTSADAAFIVDVPKIFASIGKGRSGGKGVRARASVNSGPADKAAAPGARKVRPGAPSEAGQVQKAASGPRSGAVQSQKAASDLRGNAVQGQNAASDLRSGVGQAVKTARDPTSPAGRVQEAAPGPPSVAAQRIQPHQPTQRSVPSQAALSGKPVNGLAAGRVVSRPLQRGVEYKAPMPTKVALGATVVAVFAVATLTLNWVNTSAHVTRPPISGPKVEQPAVAVPSANQTPVDATAPFGPVASVAHRVEPKAETVTSDVAPAGPQIASSNTPVADPSSFGSEAYEVIYSN